MSNILEQIIPNLQAGVICNYLSDAWEAPFVPPNGSPFFIGNMFREYEAPKRSVYSSLHSPLDKPVHADLARSVRQPTKNFGSKKLVLGMVGYVDKHV